MFKTVYTFLCAFDVVVIVILFLLCMPLSMSMSGGWEIIMELHIASTRIHTIVILKCGVVDNTTGLRLCLQIIEIFVNDFTHIVAGTNRVKGGEKHEKFIQC